MKIVLAYSGGLDTSVALRWLQERYQATIIAFCADIGQLEPLGDIREKALATGAATVYIEDLREQFLSEYAFRALKANAAYEDRYLLAAPMSRPLIARRLVEIAHQEGADAVAHGATGKGNDQVRFYTSIVAHDPGLHILAPVIDWELTSRDAEIAYAHAHAIPIPISQERPYSIDTNIWGTSIECGVLDDLATPPPAEVYQLTTDPLHAPDHPVEVTVAFAQGVPVALNGVSVGPVALVSRLNELGAAHGIGRIDIVENRLVGIKTRGIYESPAGAILHAAHRELEDTVLDRDTLHYKRQIAQRYAELVYYGQWFSPLKMAFDAFIESTQAHVSGSVTVRLYKGNITVLRRESPHALYDYGLSTYDQRDSFDHTAGKGFAYVWSMPLRVQALISTSSSSDVAR